MLQHLECKKIKKKDRRLNILLQCPSRRGVRLDKSEIRCAHIVPFSFNCKHLYYIFRSGMYRTLVMSSQGVGTLRRVRALFVGVRSGGWRNRISTSFLTESERVKSRGTYLHWSTYSYFLLPRSGNSNSSRYAATIVY